MQRLQEIETELAQLKERTTYCHESYYKEIDKKMIRLLQEKYNFTKNKKDKDIVQAFVTKFNWLHDTDE